MLQENKNSENQSHPMDDFPVRALDFGMTDFDAAQTVWSESSPEFAVFINRSEEHTSMRWACTCPISSVTSSTP